MILRYFHISLFVFASLNLAVGDQPRYPDWPLTPTEKKVEPAPKVEPVDVLPKGKLYVVLHNGEASQLLCSPPGIARIREYKDKVTLDGVFVDSKDADSETRDYEAKQIFVVKRLQPGAFELLKVPAGFKERRLLSDTVPQPLPPGPGPDPGPGPGPAPAPTPTPAKTLRVIFAVESGQNLTDAQRSVINGLAVEKWLDSHCTGGRDGSARRDKDNPTIDKPDLQGIWETVRGQVKKTPVVIVEKNTHIEIIDLEPTPEKMIAVFEEYLSGKRGQ
jgi:hypothetical protein